MKTCFVKFVSADELETYVYHGMDHPNLGLRLKRHIVRPMPRKLLTEDASPFINILNRDYEYRGREEQLRDSVVYVFEEVVQEPTKVSAGRDISDIPIKVDAKLFAYVHNRSEVDATMRRLQDALKEAGIDFIIHSYGIPETNFWKREGA